LPQSTWLPDQSLYTTGVLEQQRTILGTGCMPAALRYLSRDASRWQETEDEMWMVQSVTVVKTVKRISERTGVETTAKTARIEEGMGCEIVCRRQMGGAAHRKTLNGPSWALRTSYSAADGKDWVGQVMDQLVRSPSANTSTMTCHGHQGCDTV